MRQVNKCMWIWSHDQSPYCLWLSSFKTVNQKKKKKKELDITGKPKTRQWKALKVKLHVRVWILKAWGLTNVYMNISNRIVWKHKSGESYRKKSLLLWILMSTLLSINCNWIELFPILDGPFKLSDKCSPRACPRIQVLKFNATTAVAGVLPSQHSIILSSHQVNSSHLVSSFGQLADTLEIE